MSIEFNTRYQTEQNENKKNDEDSFQNPFGTNVLKNKSAEKRSHYVPLKKI